MQKLEILTQEQIAERISETKSAIPTTLTDEAIEGFLSGENVYATRSLLYAIKTFDPPSKGMTLWKDYLSSGNDVPIEEFSKIRLKPSTTLHYMQQAFSQFSRLHEYQTPTAIFQIVGQTLLLPKIDTLDFTRYFLSSAFMETRKLIGGKKKEGEPLLQALQPDLEEALMASSITLSNLQEAATRELINPTVARKAKGEIVSLSQAYYEVLANDFLLPDSNGQRERIYGLTYHQLPHGQKFGIEIEGILPSLAPTLKQADFLKQLFERNGLRASADAFGIILPKVEQDYQKWNITRDSTVINPLRYIGYAGAYSRHTINSAGLEIVSPILKGLAGGEDAFKAIEVLKSVGFKTNRSSGFHIHIDVSTASLQELKNFSLAFIRNERRLDDFIHPSKRGEGSYFAKTLEAVSEESVKAANSVGDLVQVVNGGSRNHKCDFTNLVTPGAPKTIQYRAEGGSGYLDTAFNYMLLVVIFTHSARSNPDITIDNLLRFYQDHGRRPSDGPPNYPDDPYPVDRHAYSKFRARFPEGGL